MFNFMKRGVKNSLCYLASSFFLSLGVLTCSSVKAEAVPALQRQQFSQARGWKRFHSPAGQCSVAFPMQPQHVQQVTPVAEGRYELRCDIYAAPFERKAVYMMLVAQYPSVMGNIDSKLSLESILNGLLMQNPTAQLKFADIIELSGYKALDFFIESEGMFFRGRVLLTENNLYLLAMKCDGHHYSEGQYTHFINSFQLSR